MSNIYIERAIAIFGLSLWLLFPIGMLVSFIQQQRNARYPSLDDSEAADEKGKKNLQEELEKENFEYEGGHGGKEDDENGVLHYLKGREKLHGEQPAQASKTP